MARKAPPEQPTYREICALLGKPVDDPAVTAVVAKSGKVKITPDHVVAKEASFEAALERRPASKKKVITAVFLYPGYRDLPAPFAFTDREALRKLAKPDAGWTLDDGDVPPTHPNSQRDTWKRDGHNFEASYDRTGAVRDFLVVTGDDQLGGREIATHPLHFETEPVDAPPDAGLVGMGLLVGWAADRFGLPDKHAGSPLGAQFAKRAVTPVAFLKAACHSTLSTDDFDRRLADFLAGYTGGMFLGTRAPNRSATDKQIAKLLGLKRADERAFTDDFLATFANVVSSPFYVPDSWQAVDRIAPVLDARWADYDHTKFKQAPDLKRYERAVKLRDAVAIEPSKRTVAASSAADDLAHALIRLIGQPVKQAKATLERAELPIGKKIDQQANPALGVAYMGANRKLAGKSVLCITHVDFFAAKQTRHIRSLHKDVEFRGYPGPIVLGVAIGASRKDIRAAFGTPARSNDDSDAWYPDAEHSIGVRYERDRAVYFHFALVEEWHTKPTPPFGPPGVF